MRDAFAVLFFVSVGMVLDPAQLMQSPGLALAAGSGESTRPEPWSRR
jgi:predicted Kef-type K+ transport protein